MCEVASVPVDFISLSFSRERCGALLQHLVSVVPTRIWFPWCQLVVRRVILVCTYLEWFLLLYTSFCTLLAGCSVFLPCCARYSPFVVVELDILKHKVKNYWVAGYL